MTKIKGWSNYTNPQKASQLHFLNQLFIFLMTFLSHIHHIIKSAMVLNTNNISDNLLSK